MDPTTKDKIKSRLNRLKTKRAEQLRNDFPFCSRLSDRLAKLYRVLSSLEEVGRDSTALDFVDLFSLFYRAMQYNAQINCIYERLGLSEDPLLSQDWLNNWDEDLKQQEDWLNDRLDWYSDSVLLNELHRPNQLKVLFILWEIELLHVGKTASGSTDSVAVSDGMVHLIKTTQSRMECILDFQPGACCAWYIRSQEVDRTPGTAIDISCGTLCRGIWLNQRACAKTDASIVRLDKDRSLKIDDTEFPNQIKLLLGLHDPGILRAYGANHISSPTFFVCEPVDPRTLQDFFEDGSKRAQLWTIFSKVAMALKNLHERRLACGGLRGSDILLTNERAVKLLPFVAVVEHDKSQSRSSVKEGSHERWKAPEELMYADTSTAPDPFKVDVYVLGLCIIESGVGVVPFGTMDDEGVMKAKIEGAPMYRSDGFSDDEWQFITCVTAHDPDERPTLEEIILKIDQLTADRHCPDCGSGVPTSHRFCGNCGTKLDLAADADADAACRGADLGR